MGGEGPVQGRGTKAVEIAVQPKTVSEPAAADATTTVITIAQRAAIAAKRQLAVDKRTFRDWEETTATKHNDNPEDKTKTNIIPVPQCGAGLATSGAVHAAIGRNFLRSTRARKSTTTRSKKDTCHFGNTTTTGNQWLRNPAPSLWVCVPSEVVLCYR